MNGDGQIDILSGSYSRMDRSMAGLFQVLWGNGKGGFRAAKALEGTDGKPLIIAVDNPKDPDLPRICTRPTAVDLDGDGKLDIVSGNFEGTFVLFRGEGRGRFAPRSTRLVSKSGKPLKVDAHSDPFFIDWDGDGDLDLVSGSSGGSVYLFRNEGSKTKPSFADSITLFRPAKHPMSPDGITLGSAHITGPGHAVRVFVADVDEDGKLDLLLGDSVTIYAPAKGLTEAAVHERMKSWSKKQEALGKEMAQAQRSKDNPRIRSAQKAYSAHWKAREKICSSDMTGFVWLLRQK
ncbi:MAG: VCBS repeat-containing protein [Planctomycetes bacterium]|nr:VCBS repeat-containing protein [Planctomycetota bacterium]